MKKLLLFIFCIPLFSNGQSSNTLKICTYNVYCFPSIIKNEKNIDRINHIADTLLQSDYDLICFQEVFSASAKAVLLKKLSKVFPYSATTIHSFSLIKINSGLMIFSKHPIVKQEQVIYRAKSKIDAMARKGALKIIIKKDEKLFSIINTHLQNAGDIQLKFTQLKELEQVISKVITNILVGDFNIDYYSTEYQKLEDDFKLTNSNSKKNKLYSYYAEKNSLIKDKKEKPKLIDYVFFKDVAKIIDSTLQNIKVFKAKNNKEKDLSDHYAIETTFYYGI